MITAIGVPFIVITFEVNRVFKQRRFLNDACQPEVSLFFLICLGTNKYVLLSVFTLKETICSQICSKSRLKSSKSLLPVYVRRSKTSLLKVLLKIATENGIYSPPMKIISNTILFVYSLCGALIKIAREYHTRWYNYFDGTTPLLEKIRRYLVAFLGST